MDADGEAKAAVAVRGGDEVIVGAVIAGAIAAETGVTVGEDIIAGAAIVGAVAVALAVIVLITKGDVEYELATPPQDEDAISGDREMEDNEQGG